jgi:hypothetical protein
MKIEQLLQFSSMITVQSTVTNNNAIKQTVIDLAPILLNSRITLPILKYPGKCDNIFLAQMIRIGTDFFEKFCLIPVINTVNYFVDFYMSFILLLF